METSMFSSEVTVAYLGTPEADVSVLREPTTFVALKLWDFGTDEEWCFVTLTSADGSRLHAAIRQTAGARVVAVSRRAEFGVLRARLAALPKTTVQVRLETKEEAQEAVSALSRSRRRRVVTDEDPDEEGCLAARCLSALPALALVRVWAAIVFEARVVLRANDRTLLAPLAAALVKAAGPLPYIHVLAPVLPSAEAVDVLDAPVPYLVGVTRRERREWRARSSFSSPQQQQQDDEYTTSSDLKKHINNNTADDDGDDNEDNDDEEDEEEDEDLREEDDDDDDGAFEEAMHADGVVVVDVEAGSVRLSREFEERWRSLMPRAEEAKLARSLNLVGEQTRSKKMEAAVQKLSKKVTEEWLGPRQSPAQSTEKQSEATYYANNGILAGHLNWAQVGCCHAEVDELALWLYAAGHEEQLPALWLPLSDVESVSPLDARRFELVVGQASAVWCVRRRTRIVVLEAPSEASARKWSNALEAAVKQQSNDGSTSSSSSSNSASSSPLSKKKKRRKKASVLSVQRDAIQRTQRTRRYLEQRLRGKQGPLVERKEGEEDSERNMCARSSSCLSLRELNAPSNAALKRVGYLNQQRPSPPRRHNSTGSARSRSLFVSQPVVLEDAAETVLSLLERLVATVKHHPAATLGEQLLLARNSSGFAAFEEAASTRLATSVTPHPEAEEATAFYINLHNLIVLHACVARGLPPMPNGASSGVYYAWLRRLRYKVGNVLLTPLQIEHAILRARVPGAGSSSLGMGLFFFSLLLPRFADFSHDGAKIAELRLKRPPPPTVSFALFAATKSSPPLCVIRSRTTKEIDLELAVHAASVLAQAVSCSLAESAAKAAAAVVVLPQLVRWYAADWGRGDAAVLAKVHEVLRSAPKQQNNDPLNSLLALLKDFEERAAAATKSSRSNLVLKYSPYDWAPDLALSVSDSSRGVPRRRRSGPPPIPSPASFFEAQRTTTRPPPPPRLSLSPTRDSRNEAVEENTNNNVTTPPRPIRSLSSLFVSPSFDDDDEDDDEEEDDDDEAEGTGRRRRCHRISETSSPQLTLAQKQAGRATEKN